MQTIETLLRSRGGGDNRALTGVIDVRHNKLFVAFGQIGAVGRLLLRVDGNDVTCVSHEITPRTADTETAALTAALATANEEIASLGAAAKAQSDALAEMGRSEGGGASSGATIPAEGENGAQPPVPANEQPKKIDPDAHKHADLVAMAEAAKIAVPAKATKADIAKLLNDAAEASK